MLDQNRSHSLQESFGSLRAERSNLKIKGVSFERDCFVGNPQIIEKPQPPRKDILFCHPKGIWKKILNVT